MSSFHGLWSLGSNVRGSDCDFCSDAGFYTSPTCSIFILDFDGDPRTFVLLDDSSGQEEKGEKTPLLVRPSGKVLSLGILCLLGMVAEGTAVDWSAIYSSSVLGLAQPSCADLHDLYDDNDGRQTDRGLGDP